MAGKWPVGLQVFLALQRVFHPCNQDTSSFRSICSGDTSLFLWAPKSGGVLAHINTESPNLLLVVLYLLLRYLVSILCEFQFLHSELMELLLVRYLLLMLLQLPLRLLQLDVQGIGLHVFRFLKSDKTYRIAKNFLKAFIFH